jgi:hypothetical protein
MLPNHLFFTQSISYVFSSFFDDCLPTFGQVFDLMLEEICWFGCEEVKPILELSIVEGNSVQIVGESGRGGNPMWQGPESREDVEESPRRVPEWPLSSCLQYVVRHYHAEESLHVDPGFAGLLPPYGEVVENNVQQ